MQNWWYVSRNKIRSLRLIAKTLGFVWKISPLLLVVIGGIILMETLLLYYTLFQFRELINFVAYRLQSGESLYLDEGLSKQLFYLGGSGFLLLTSRSLTIYMTEKQAARIELALADRLHEKALDLDLAYYENSDYYELLMRARSADPNQVIKTFIGIIKNGLSMGIVVWILAATHWVLLPTLILFIIPMLFIRLYYADKTYQLQLKYTPIEREAQYLSELLSSISFAKEIRTYGLGGFFRTRYRQRKEKLIDKKFMLVRRRVFAEWLMFLMGAMSFLFCIGVIAQATVKGNTSVGDITVFLAASLQCFTLLVTLSSSLSSLYHQHILMANLFELLELKNDIVDTNTPHEINSSVVNTGKLAFHSVGFAYPNTSKFVLNDLDLTINQGKIIGLAGFNGAGKSTFIKLLSRLYDPVQGKISYNGIDIKELKIAEYRRLFAYVFQDFVQYQLFAKENIQLGNIDAELDLSKIEAAAQHSGAAAFIKDFPDGYDTQMGRLFEHGHEVSIGQWQKLAIARALYSNAPFLVLDEATSAMDVQSEKEFFQALKKHHGHKGILLISHRPSTIEQADYVYVLNEGHIVQEGKPRDLKQQGGLFAAFMESEIDNRDN